MYSTQKYFAFCKDDQNGLGRQMICNRSGLLLEDGATGQNRWPTTRKPNFRVADDQAAPKRDAIKVNLENLNLNYSTRVRVIIVGFVTGLLESREGDRLSLSSLIEKP